MVSAHPGSSAPSPSSPRGRRTAGCAAGRAPPGEGLRAPAPAHCAALALTLRRVALRARYLGIGTASVSSWRLATGDSECDWVAAVGEGDGAEPLTFGHLGEDVFLDVLVGFTAKTGSPVRQTLR